MMTSPFEQGPLAGQCHPSRSARTSFPTTSPTCSATTLRLGMLAWEEEAMRVFAEFELRAGAIISHTLRESPQCPTPAG